jgi:predicted acyl esterase
MALASGAAAGAALAGAAGSATAPWRPPEPLGVEHIENLFVPTGDGERLAVELWLPAGARARPAPVVLEAIPYRKRDRYRAYDRLWGQTLASRGVAYARLDCRGSGDSTGFLADEYLPREQQDAAEAIAWLAAQPWCSGAVGMRGVSWGGFLTLQTAALRPPALKAIMPMCASDRRYLQDAHYVGGAFGLTGLKWATSMRLVQAGAPDPQITGPAWKEIWAARLRAAPPIAARWLSHPLEDDYWRQGSVGLDPGAIACPVYLAGGLYDPYTPAIPRLLEALTVPRKALIGPWRHGYPLPAAPGPALDWAFEEVRWWRHHLLGEATGIMAEPMLRVFMADANLGEHGPGPIPGRWIAEPSWPAPRVHEVHLPLGGTDARIAGDRIVGLHAFEWVPFAAAEDPGDPSADDARSVLFDLSAPDGVELLGRPSARLRLAAAAACGQIGVRLSEVDPKGGSWLVAWGLLDLSRRHGPGRNEPPTPGALMDVEVPLSFVARRLAPGRRLRLALSSGLWPLAWPARQAADLTLETAHCRLTLPVRAAPKVEAPMPTAEVPGRADDPAAGPRVEITAPAREGDAWRICETWPTASNDIPEIAVTTFGSGPNIEARMIPGAPQTCVWRSEQTSGWRREAMRIDLKASVQITAPADEFLVEEETLATLNGEVVAHVRQSTRVPRL